MTHKRKEDLFLDIILYFIVTVIAVLMLYPFLNVVAVSLSDYSAYLSNPVMIWPHKINTNAFKHILGQSLIKYSYANTVIVTVAGTIIGLVLTTLTAYPLSRRELKGKAVIMNMIIFTMMFSGGIIPKFFLISGLGMLDSLWALILPASLTGFNVILMKNFFSNLPYSLEEAAKIDGASDPYILFKIVIPLSKPIIATIALFLAVMYWNSFFSAVLYLRSREKWTLQLLLREVIYAATSIFESTGGNLAEQGIIRIPPVSLQYATLIVAILPILCVYPFLQKYFVKGVMIGAVKG